MNDLPLLVQTDAFQKPKFSFSIFIYLFIYLFAF